LHRLRNDPIPDWAKNTTLAACFLNDHTVALLEHDGTLVAMDTNTKRRETVTRVCVNDMYSHTAQVMPIRGGPYLVCSIYGDNGMAVIDWKDKTTLWRADGNLALPIHHEGKLFHEADSVWKQREGLCFHMEDAAIGELVLAVRDIATGKLLMEYERDENFDSLVLDAKNGILWAAVRKKLFKYRIDLTMP
jgi:hypothetical protein